MSENLLTAVELSVAYTLIAAANDTDQKTAVIDTQGFEGVMFVTPITVETTTGTVTLDVHGDTASDGNTSALITGATAAALSTGADTAGKALVVDVYKPMKRYALARLQTGVANMTLGPTIAILYQAHNKPTTQAATILASTFVVGS